MEGYYQEASSLLSLISSDLGRLEKAIAVGSSYDVENEIQTKVRDVFAKCKQLDYYVAKEPPDRRPRVKERVDQLKYDARHLNAAFENMVRRRVQREQQERERQALLQTRYRPNAEARLDIDSAAAGVEHSNSLASANSGLDDLIENAQNVHSRLVQQRGMLDGVRSRMVSVGNYLGLSNTTMRLIEKRSSQDRIIMIVAMVIFCILMYLIVKFLT